MNRRNFCASMVALPASLSAAASLNLDKRTTSGTSLVWNAARVLHITLSEPLDHPFFWWPTTLLSYPIDFEQSVDINHLLLTRVDTSARIPIQFSNLVLDAKGVRSATLNFFADLPSGARRAFVLSEGNIPVVHTPQITENHEGDTIVLDSGSVRVRIPASQAVFADAPGPIMQLGRGSKWIGKSVLDIVGDKVTRISTTRVEHGPLFILYEIAYETAMGSRYIARVQANAGFDFVRLQEDMEGLLPGVKGTVTTNWSGFDVTHRQAPNHPFPLPDAIVKYEDYPWERIDDPWRSRDVIQGASIPIHPWEFPAGQVPFTLGAHETWTAFYIGTFANFWDVRSNDALGVFIDKVAEWQDHEYAYEVESPTLQVGFFYDSGQFLWRWPLARGRRSTCVAFYDHDKDKQAMRQLEQSTLPVVHDGLSYHVQINVTSHLLFLQNRYGTLDLNCIKDWILDYPESGRRPPQIFERASGKTAADLEREIMTSDFVGTLPLFGTRQNGGHGPIPTRGIVNFSPVPCRRILGSWVSDYTRLVADMTPHQRRRLTAMYLLISYVHAAEDFMPLVPMLGGHPNFLADVKATPAAMAFLFPDHPMAPTWADLWQKFVELNTHFNTRPAVEAWHASGGRWTEDLGTYVWAFLRPALRTEFLLRKYDGRERFLSPQLPQMAEWLVRSLSAPFDGESDEGYRRTATLDGGHDWGVLAPGKGPQRVHPPQGAHAERRVPPRSLWYLGTCLERYAPLAAEHAMWAARPTNQDMETALNSKDTWDIMYQPGIDNRGTKPQLRSEKFTGYGIVLRAGVDTPQEVSIHLQQIDQGPNYRWGRPAEGGCGVLYFFAAGKAYSHNGAEDVGDRLDQDTDFSTNFGVYKEGTFRSIGENVLSRPFYDLGTGQFAEIVPRREGRPYCTPEYVSRSVMLAGHDYFIVYDAVLNQSITHRLSWFVRRGDELPTLQLIRGGSGDPRSTQRTDHQTEATTGVWFDGTGDSMALVSHRKDIEAEATPFGCRVHGEDILDLVFCNPAAIRFCEGSTLFEGMSGLIRMASGEAEFALFHGTRISVAGYEFETESGDLGIGGRVVPGQPVGGVYHAPTPATLTLRAKSVTDKTVFYVDGIARPARREKEALQIDLDAGQHHWELTDDLPVPMAPAILRTENKAGGARVILTRVAAASRYQLEVSEDNGATWVANATAAQPEIEIDGLTNGKKIHLRAIALNTAHESAPGPEYPLYVTNEPPPTPDGLHVELAAGAATVTWGEVLGAREYRLYLRVRGASELHLLYQGKDRTYLDKRSSIEAPVAVPGARAVSAPTGIVEYLVAAANANGESRLSAPADTDPTSWRNWNPKPGEPFRRVYSYPPDSPQLPGEPARYYPS